MAKAQGKAKGGKRAASTTTTRKTASKTTSSRKSGKPAAKKPATRTPAARKPAARKPAARTPAAKPAPKQGAKKPSARATKKAPTPPSGPSLEVGDCLYSPFDEERFDEPVHVDCAIVIQLGDYKMMSYLNSMMGLTELVIPPKPDGYASRRELSEAVEQALDAPLPALAVEMFKLVRERFPRETDAWLSIYSGGMPWIDMPATEPLKTMDEIARMSVRDFYVDQCCDAVVVTEVTEDTVTVLCDYGS